MVLDHNYIDLKNRVIKAERRILKELGFCVHVKHPHKVKTLDAGFVLEFFLDFQPFCVSSRSGYVEGMGAPTHLMCCVLRRFPAFRSLLLSFGLLLVLSQ